MPKVRKPDAIVDTIYGRFLSEAKRRLELTYDYEASEIRAFRRVAEALSPTLLLDVGANIGVYAIFLSEIASLRRIFAFEPAPDTFRLLERNVDLQRSTRFFCRNAALSDAAGTARFAIFGALAGNNAITAAPRVQSNDTIEVTTARLDDEVEAEGETFMSKIDVEGHEIKVLAGATDLLSRNTGVLQIEAFNQIGALDALLRDLGYARIFRMKHDYYYTNLADTALREAIVEIMFEEVAQALNDLKDEHRRRRAAIRTSREVFDLLKFSTDPVVGVKEPVSIARVGRKGRR